MKFKINSKFYSRFRFYSTVILGTWFFMFWYNYGIKVNTDTGAWVCATLMYMIHSYKINHIEEVKNE